MGNQRAGGSDQIASIVGGLFRFTTPNFALRAVLTTADT